MSAHREKRLVSDVHKRFFFTGKEDRTMPGCSALGCSNRSEKGMFMKAFPRDPQRRAEWASRAQRNVWEITDHFFLCESHFSEKQWEKPREDGKQKLKAFAVPDLFPTSPKKVRKLFFDSIEKANEVDKTSCNINETSCNVESNQTVTSDFIEEVEIRNEGMNEDKNEIDKALEVLKLKVTDDEIVPDRQRRVRFENTELDTKRELDRVSKVAQRLRKEVSKICNDVEILQVNQDKFKEVFTDDQLDVLCQRLKIGFQWSDVTINKALHLWFTCGVLGYNQLLELRLPFPSEDDLKQYFRKQDSQSGILSDIFRWLELKVCHLESTSKNCVLIIDEVVFKCNGRNYAKALETSCYAILTLRSITGLWQQVVGYHILHITSNVWISKYLISNVIDRAEDLDLKIHAVTLNGSERFCNHIWKAFGISCNHVEAVNCIRNPYDPLRKVFFLAHIRCITDHLINNLNSAGNITFSKDLIIQYKLPSCSVAVKHLSFLADDSEINNSPEVKGNESDWISCLLQPDSYHKMLKTMAWFKDFCSRWLHLMSVGDPMFGLTRKKPEEYKNATNFLSSVMHVFKNIRLGNDGNWKPVQSEIIVTTQSVLDLQDLILNSKHQETFLTSAVTTGRLGLKCEFTTVEELVTLVKNECLNDFLKPVSVALKESNSLLLEHDNYGEEIDKLLYFK